MLWALGACPRLIIPTELWKSLDERQRGTLLVHELAHLRRGDHRVRIFELVVTALYWWNPVLWWARQALRDVEEQCCDAWVVWAFPEAAKSYAETLLETLDFLNQSELSEPLLASGFGKVQHLRRRLTMIMSGTTPRLLGLRGALAALSLASTLLPMNASWAQKPEEQQEIRIVVKTDDGKDKAVKSGDALDATGAFVFAQDPTNRERPARSCTTPIPSRPATDIVFSSDAFVVDDKAASDVKAGQKSKITVVLKTDDSTVSVSADSVEEAIKKIRNRSTQSRPRRLAASRIGPMQRACCGSPSSSSRSRSSKGGVERRGRRRRQTWRNGRKKGRRPSTGRRQNHKGGQPRKEG